MLNDRVRDDAERCPRGHKLAEWFDDQGRPLRRTDQPYVVEAKRCPACDAVELAKNRPGSDKDDPAIFYVLVPRHRDDDDENRPSLLLGGEGRWPAAPDHDDTDDNQAASEFDVSVDRNVGE